MPYILLLCIPSETHGFFASPTWKCRMVSSTALPQTDTSALDLRTSSGISSTHLLPPSQPPLATACAASANASGPLPPHTTTRSTSSGFTEARLAIARCATTWSASVTDITDSLSNPLALCANTMASVFELGPTTNTEAMYEVALTALPRSAKNLASDCRSPLPCTATTYSVLSTQASNDLAVVCDFTTDPFTSSLPPKILSSSIWSLPNASPSPSPATNSGPRAECPLTKATRNAGSASDGAADATDLRIIAPPVRRNAGIAPTVFLSAAMAGACFFRVLMCVPRKSRIFLTQVLFSRHGYWLDLPAII
mmetsp:Transcript_20733/g.35702  ORF Transcript_20733/g.35702 Transcript_20733/m.35702 type:complete len:310 (-) Transcript_20733:65-994(-)